MGGTYSARHNGWFGKRTQKQKPGWTVRVQPGHSFRENAY